jgi:hypothetical protein
VEIVKTAPQVLASFIPPLPLGEGWGEGSALRSR